MKVKIRKTIRDQSSHLKPLKIHKNDPNYEFINGIPLRVDRTASIAVVNHLGIVLKIEGDNPRRLNRGDSIYEI